MAKPLTTQVLVADEEFEEMGRMGFKSRDAYLQWRFMVVDVPATVRDGIPTVRRGGLLTERLDDRAATRYEWTTS